MVAATAPASPRVIDPAVPGPPPATGTAERAVEAVQPPVADAATRIRRHLRAVFADWAVPVEAAEGALLVVEELVANVVDHARTPFRLRVEHTGAALRVAVRDDSPDAPDQRPVDPHSRRGRGLAMVDAIAHRWGCDRTPTGKTVWALLPA
jgi:anti-sigma regulatory factor (Ser/Thr protein kinase)